MRRPLKIVLTVAFGLAAFIVIAMLAGIRINTTASYPIGVYIMTNAPIEKGALVIFCPPDNAAFRLARGRSYIGAGFCPGGYGYMIKKILAAKNDLVEISADGVAVNGTLLPNSKPMEADSEGHPLPYIEVAIAALNENSVLLMSDYNPKSFDARYFGLVDKSQVISAIRPVWTQ
jgi:conjugative transfer signal peptidase TraF